MMKKVLFLCTHNSSRSQMAEGLVNSLLSDSWIAFSAGTQPSKVHPLAVRVMNEIDIDISGHRSKHVDEFSWIPLDIVITVCGNAEKDCPVWISEFNKVHISFADPAAALGTEEERLTVFRRIRDELRREIIPLLESTAWEDENRAGFS